MKTLILTLATTIVLLGVAYARCHEEDIDSVGDGGSIIVLLDGTVWESLDPATSSTWLDAEAVLVCSNGKMINKDEGETIDVIQLR